MRKTKIVCTIGPACETQGKLEALVNAGMNVARLNMSHADHPYHEQAIKNIRLVSEALDRPIGILMDLQGPKVRIGLLKGPVNLEPGQDFTLTTRDVPGDSKEVNVPFKELPGAVAAGQTLLLDDGLIELKVQGVTETDIRTKVVRGGELKSRKGINLPHSTLNIPAITEKDIEDLDFGIRQGVDLIAMSFVRRPEDVLDLRRLMEERGADIPVIAKIEKHEGVKNIDGIMDVVYGIMVARGDLGIEIPMAEVPIVQKMLIAKCNAKGLPVITATQMLDSMIRNPIPTRAEATDVANAVFDGTDALMLSGETAFGEYPVKAVETMARIAKYTEDSPVYRNMIDYQNAPAVHVDHRHRRRGHLRCGPEPAGAGDHHGHADRLHGAESLPLQAADAHSRRDQRLEGDAPARALVGGGAGPDRRAPGPGLADRGSGGRLREQGAHQGWRPRSDHSRHADRHTREH